MSLWTYVEGEFTIRFATDYCFVKDDEKDAGFMQEPLDIYKVMMNAPRITGSESDCIFSVDITNQAPYYSNEDNFIYYEAKIKIKVSNRPLDNFDWSDDEDYQYQIYDLGEKTEKDN